MEKTHLVPRIYGYAVCLVSIIVVLVAVGNIISSLFDRANPAYATGYNFSSYRDVSSFDAYKADLQTNTPADMKTSITSLTDAEMRANYESARTSHIDQVKYGSLKSIVMFGSLLLIAVALFTTHWKWLRKLDK